MYINLRLGTNNYGTKKLLMVVETIRDATPIKTYVLFSSDIIK